MDQGSQRPVKVDLPAYWVMRSLESGSARKMVTESEEVKRAVQTIFDKTWKNQWTRDRGKAKICKFEVLMVQRNENAKLFTEYMGTRQALVSKAKGWEKYPAKTQTEVQGDENARRFVERAGMRADVNECYLFHGTTPEHAKSICENDFTVKLAGTATGNPLYGPGIYLAEASSKSDEYCRAEPDDSLYAGSCAMLICRVVLGNVNYCDLVTPSVQQLVDTIIKDKTHHSILGDRERCRGTYREFIIFDNCQVYPEYVVIYNRVQP